MTTPIQSTHHPDVVLVGAGIMSAMLAVMLRELDPSRKIELYEAPVSEAQESSNAWNNAGTGHAALCELNNTPQESDGTIDISKAPAVNTEFDLSREIWAYFVKKEGIKDPQSFIHPLPRFSFVRGSENVAFLKERYKALSAHPCYHGMEYSDDSNPGRRTRMYNGRRGDFTMHPGDVLRAVDHTGSGHKWRWINDEPWKRAYVVFKEAPTPISCRIVHDMFCRDR